MCPMSAIDVRERCPSEFPALIRFGFLLATGVVLLDQSTKYLIIHYVMASPHVIEVTSFFNIVMVWNKGASFGLFATHSTWTQFVLGALAIIITLVLVAWLRKAQTSWLACALGLLIGGALGNVIDRVVYRQVADFLDFHALGYHWPSFNVADIAISCGVVMLLFDSLIVKRRNNRFKD